MLADAASPTPRSTRSSARRTGTRLLDLGLLAGLGLLATLLRLPNLQTAPPFTDEVLDLYRGFLAAQGRLVPLTDTSTYIGSLWNWTVAAAFRLTGYNLAAPRGVMLGLGVLSVLACYPLGRAWSGGSRLGGVVTALLLATSATHIAVNSHLAWANCATPLFTSLAIWLTWRSAGGETEGGRRGVTEVGRRKTAGESDPPQDPGLSTQDSGLRTQDSGLRTQDSGLRTRPSGLVLSGLFWGLALQTHPSVLGLLLGTALFYCWRVPGAWRHLASWLAAALVLLVNLNLIVFNLSSGFGSVVYGLRVTADYSNSEQLTPLVYLTRLAGLVFGLFQNLGGAVDPREGVGAYLADPSLWPASLLAIAGAIRLWRRGNPLPILLLIGMALVLPLFNGKYKPIVDGRYLAPLYPVFFAGAAALLVAALERLRTVRPRTRPALVAGALVLGLAVSLIGPLLHLRAYYEQDPRPSRVNDRLFQALELIKANRPGQEIVIVDRPLQDLVLGPGDGRVADAFRLGLDLLDIPNKPGNLTYPELLEPANRCRDQLVVAAARRPDVNEALFNRLELRALDGGPARPPNPNAQYGVFRLPRLAGSPGAC